MIKVILDNLNDNVHNKMSLISKLKNDNPFQFVKSKGAQRLLYNSTREDTIKFGDVDSAFDFKKQMDENSI